MKTEQEKDIEKFENNYKKLKDSLGQETLDKYIAFWYKEFFKGSEHILETLTYKNQFRRIAIDDLVKAKGSPRAAIEKVREEKDKLNKPRLFKLKTVTENHFRVF